MPRKKAPPRTPSPPPPAAPPSDTNNDEIVHVDEAGKGYTYQDLNKIETYKLFDNVIVGKKSCICKVYVHEQYQATEYPAPGNKIVCHAIFLFYNIYLSYFL